MSRIYGAFTHDMMVDAMVGSDLVITAEMLNRLVESGFMVRGSLGPTWVREKLMLLSTDTLTSVYVSMKEMKFPQELSTDRPNP